MVALQSPPIVTKSDMDGNGSKIEIFKPFGEAFELMKKILFQPFDLKKWFVIGFAAWLASLGSGSSFNYPSDRGEVKEVNDAISQIPHSILVTGVVLVIVVVLVLIVLFAWLRARGGFMFIDCIAKNRGAIKEPWRDFRKEGNSYFFFSLLVVFVMITNEVAFVAIAVSDKERARKFYQETLELTPTRTQMDGA